MIIIINSLKLNYTKIITLQCKVEWSRYKVKLCVLCQCSRNKFWSLYKCIDLLISCYLNKMSWRKKEIELFFNKYKIFNFLLKKKKTFSGASLGNVIWAFIRTLWWEAPINLWISEWFPSLSSSGHHWLITHPFIISLIKKEEKA